MWSVVVLDVYSLHPTNATEISLKFGVERFQCNVS